ncbi:hypothetical protein B0H65DRAFT_416293, partial [Neurospora tetraspora]
ASIDVGNGRQATLTRPGSFLITPELDFSLVSVHTLARLGVGYNKFKPTSNLIGYIVSPSGRDVLARSARVGLVIGRVYRRAGQPLGLPV